MADFRPPRSRRARRHDQQGTALLEFAILANLLFLLVFGIISFGLLLGSRQVLTQAVSEGARAAVPIRYLPAVHTDVRLTAHEQVNRSLEIAGRRCPSPPDSTSTLQADHIVCVFVVHDCDSPPGTDDLIDTDDCLTVAVVLDNRYKPLAPRLPFVSVFLPDSLTSRATVRLANCQEAPSVPCTSG